jgi:uncharacterized protein (DUF433 family)
MNWRAAVRDGIYPVAFAAKMTEATNATVASWFRASDGLRLPPAIITHFEPIGGQLLMPFLALVEARFVARFRKHGLSLQTIRKAARKLRDAYKLEHPFAKYRFRTDGKKVMMEEAVHDDERRLIDIMTDEFGFQSVIEPSLFDTVVYIDDIAARLKPFDEFPNVIVDPRFALGRPVVESGYVPTDTLAAAFLAEGDIDGVAEWYGTDRDSVTQAVAFEQRLAA